MINMRNMRASDSSHQITNPSIIIIAYAYKMYAIIFRLKPFRL